MPRLTLLLAALLMTSLAQRASAAPVPADAVLPEPALPLASLAGPTMDVDHWVREEAQRLMLARSIDEDRRALLQQGWQARPPTWIQAGALVNLGDFPSLDDSVDKAERDLQTLTWVLEQQQRQAMAAGSRRGDPADAGTEDDRWIRRLLPQHWIPLLKAHREWVVAGGTTMLLVVWAASIFARRPGSPPMHADAVAPKPRRQRRHRRRGLQLQ